MNPEISYIILLLLGIMSFLYASVGHGGASGYLAVMGLFSFAPSVMKPTALVLNILVSAVAFAFYYKAKLFKWNLFYPFAITSVPFSFIGGYIKIDTAIYKVLLGIILLFSIIRILFFFKKDTIEIKPINIYKALFIGAVIGLLSGLLGIGGGIILSPVILLLGWSTIKETAAVSALFIFVNSLAGFFGFLTQGGNLSLDLLPIIGIVFIGGLLGGYSGSKKFDFQVFRYVLSLVLLIASIKLILV